jgi:hypothetical protein
MKDLKQLEHFNYKCIMCVYGTNLKTDFNRHLSTKKHIKTVESQPIIFKCQFCDKEFKSNPSKRRHELHRCKENAQKLKNQLEKTENEIKTMKVEKLDLYRKIDKLIDKVGNTTINNTININSYGNEDYSHINNNLLNYLVTIPYGMIPKMIEETHFNDSKPENKNIKMTLANKKDNIIQVYQDNGWIYKDKSQVLDDLMDSKYSVIDTHYDKLENSNAINPLIRTKYLKFRKFFDEGDREMVASLKKECELILLNNRKK